MEQYFRITLWMAILIGCLQTAPIEKSNLRLDLLREEVQCDPNVTFSSPANVQKHCYAAALKTIMEGLNHFRVQCQKTWRINQTLETLHMSQDKPPKLPQPTSSSDCKWDKVEFGRFVNDTESFIEMLN